MACASKLSPQGLVHAASVFYGIPDLKFFPTNSIACPVELNFGSKDNLSGFSDPVAVKNLCDKLTQDGKSFKLHSYEGVRFTTNGIFIALYYYCVLFIGGLIVGRHNMRL